MVDAVVQGGWIMAAIGLCSIIALAVMLERTFALRRRRVISPSIAQGVEVFAPDTDETALLALCNTHPGAFSRLVAVIMEMRRLDRALVFERMRAAGRIEVDKLERGLTLLEIIAATAPLLGLLGTVWGMMEVFAVISAEGLGDAQLLSQGISRALITTIAGLCVAMPALAFHGILTRRVNTLAAEMQDRATALILRLHARQDSANDV